MSSLLKDESSSLNKIMYEKIKVDAELNYEKLAEDSFKAELDETVKLESDKILSGVKSESYSNSTTASIMSQHGNKRLFKCGFCSSTFADTYKLERHVKSEHRDITDRAKYETFPWQEPGASSSSSGSSSSGTKSSNSHRNRAHSTKTLFIDPSQQFNNIKPNILSKLKIEPVQTAQQQHHHHHHHHQQAPQPPPPPPPPPPQVQQPQTVAIAEDPQQTSVVSSEYFLCQVCSKIFASYKDFTYHVNESLACKNGGGAEEDAFTSNDVLVILSPEASLKFAGETILDTVVEATAGQGASGHGTTSEVIAHQTTTPTAVYECHICRALFASADYLKRHLEICQTSNPKRRKT